MKATLGLASARPLEDSRASLLIVVAATMATAALSVMADSFGPVRYDSNRDQLIVTMIYDGTNPNHHFSIQWGPAASSTSQTSRGTRQ